MQRVVEVRLVRAGSYARLSVHDTGAGIPHEFLPYVIARFRQADAVLSGAPPPHERQALSFNHAERIMA